MAVTTIDSAPGIDVPSMLKEAGITAFVALLLTIPLVGFRTFEQSGMLTWGTDFTSVAIAVGLVFVGRIGLILSREGRPEPVLWIAGAVLVILLVDWILLDIGIVALLHTEALRVIAIGGSGVLAIRAGMAMGAARSLLSADEREKRMDAISAGMLDATRWLGPILIVIAFALPVLFPDRALLGNVIVVLIYTMLAWGLNIIVGLAGLLDLGYVAFYAVGAYSFALMSQWTDLGFWTLLPLTGALSASFGLLLGYPVLRLRGDYFAIVTLGFGEIIRVVLLNWSEVTGGPNGILAVPRPTFFGQTFTGLDRVIYLYYIILVMALVVNFFSIRIRKLPIGRAWEALREDDVACQSLGINRTKIKLAAFGISAMFGGFAGCFFATYNGSVFPESFTFIESAIILAIVVLGGMGNQLGIVLAAILLIGLPQTEQLRGLVEYRMLAFGLGMVFIMIWRPKGLLSHRDPSVLLHGTRRFLGGVKR